MDFFETVEQRMDLEAARTTPPRGFPAIPEIPAARYTSEAFFELEMEYVWRNTWRSVSAATMTLASRRAATARSRNSEHPC
jgi:hypothetical protein